MLQGDQILSWKSGPTLQPNRNSCCWEGGGGGGGKAFFRTNKVLGVFWDQQGVNETQRFQQELVVNFLSVYYAEKFIHVCCDHSLELPVTASAVQRIQKNLA